MFHYMSVHNLTNFILMDIQNFFIFYYKQCYNEHLYRRFYIWRFPISFPSRAVWFVYCCFFGIIIILTWTHWQTRCLSISDQHPLLEAGYLPVGNILCSLETSDNLKKTKDLSSCKFDLWFDLYLSFSSYSYYLKIIFHIERLLLVFLKQNKTKPLMLRTIPSWFMLWFALEKLIIIYYHLPAI